MIFNIQKSDQGSLASRHKIYKNFPSNNEHEFLSNFHFSMAAYHELEQTGDRLANSVPTAGTLLSGTSTSINEVVVNERKQLHKSLQLQKTQY